MSDHRWGRGVAPRLLFLTVLLLLTACGEVQQPGGSAPEPTTSAAQLSPTPSARPTRTPRTPAPSATTKVPITGTEPSAAGSERATRPERLVVGRIDLSVVPVGVADDGTMELPDTVSAIGWYQFGARPADRSGTTVLAGHVDTRKEGLGPLARLRSLDRGAQIEVTAADGTARRYRVENVELIRKARVPLEQIFARDGAETLVVITCGGPYSRQTGYRDNVVVTARPVGAGG